MKNATVKCFNVQKGYGFLTDSETGKDVFCHYSQIQMEGFKALHKDDVVEYELGMGNGRQPFIQAVKVKPILTRKMVEDSLKEDNLHIQTFKDEHCVTKYLVVDQNNVIQSSEQGMSFLELAAYAGYEIVEQSA
ncbi:MAG: cold shock domain-containing protein [Lachnospiraceae bacterium]|nr:cold shock domain-containing protein [Lachnospiraceae bacterium]